jgi:integrase
MPNKKSTTKAKEPVRIRERKLANGNVSLYLDIYSKGVRKVESLGLYIVPEKTPIDKRQNQETRKIAEKIKSDRILALQSYGIKQYEKIRQIGKSLIEYLVTYENDNENLSASSIRGRREMRCRITDYLKMINRPALHLVDVDDDFCRGFLGFLKTAPNKSCKLKGGTISNGNALSIQTIFTGALNKAVRDGLIPSNPMSLLDSKEKFHPTESTREYLTIEELKRAIEAPALHEDTKKAFLFSCFTGLRLGDVQSLTWRHIQTAPDGKSKFVKVRMQKTQKWINVPLSDEALRWLPVKEDLDEPIFHLYDPVNIEKHIAIWMRNAKIDKHITYHCSRHTFATMMLTLDVDLYTVSKLLGHSKITTTQIYAKIIDKKRVDAVSKVDGIF